MADEDKKIRLSKYMSQLGICSRREADSYIEKGRVMVNGEVVEELGYKIVPPVKVELTAAARTEQNRKLSVALYKPIGYVSGPAEENYPSALDLLIEDNRMDSTEGPRMGGAVKNGMAPAGRLDVDSTGLLLYTANGVLAKKVIGENTAIEKEYVVRVRGTVSDQQIQQLSNGTLDIDGKQLKPATVNWNSRNSRLTLILKEGKKRQVRKMCEMVGVELVALRRRRVGSVTLDGLNPGQWRYLSAEEVNNI